MEQQEAHLNEAEPKYQMWEDFIIIKEHIKHGDQWNEIASKLKNRTANSVEKRWTTYLNQLS